MHPALRVSLIAIASLFLHAAQADTVRVMTTGLGEGGVTAPGINCGAVSGTIDCDETATGTITLTAAANAGSTFASWGGDCPDTDPTTPANQCLVSLASFRSVRAQFDRTATVAALTEAQIADVAATRSGIGDYLTANAGVDTVAEFIAALPVEYRRNWLLMPRSESLQTGTAAHPRILLPNAFATNAFAISLREPHDPSYPASFRTAVEFMQWDDAQKTFRFHEIALTAIPNKDPIPSGFRFPGRPRGVSIDDTKCFACHSTRNVFNRGTTPGTDGVSRDVPVKMKPNWDAYDSWGGMLPFNRDRIHKGSVEAAAFRKLFNLWTWQSDPTVRAVVEQLEFQPPLVPDGTPARTRTHANDDGSTVLMVTVDDRITRLTAGGPNDGHVVFGFDAPGAPTTSEPQPSGPGPSITYEFNRRAGTVGTPVVRDPSTSPTDLYPYTQFVTLHHTTGARSDAGRGVRFMDFLGQVPNAQRVADEVKTHRYATGSVPFDVRPLALAIASGCITVPETTDIGTVQTVSPALPAAAQAFFDARNGMSFNDVFDDTRRRQFSMTLRKADIQKLTIDRTADHYVLDENGPGVAPAAPEVVNGLIQQYGGATSGVAGGSGGVDTSLLRLRQEVFRRPIDRGVPDATVMGGILVDRENYSDNAIKPLALFRYFLEPLGVTVDKWSPNVRGRSRTYTFAQTLFGILGELNNPEPGGIRESLGIPPPPVTDPPAPTTEVCAAVMPMVTASLASLPAIAAVPTYTDIQRVFNKSCIECHGGLGYPPYRNHGGAGVPINFAENESPAPGERRLQRSYGVASSMVGADPLTSLLYQKITDNGRLAHPYNPGQPYNAANPDDPTAPDVADERCREGLMPCGGPPLTKTDIETIRRWIEGSAPGTEGDPHIRTVDGVHYDFQAAGEFTLLRDAGIELQARQTPVPTAAPIADAHTGLTACVSINSAIALRVGNHRITYQPNLAKNAPQPGAMILRVDESIVRLGSGTLPLAGGGRVLGTSVPGGIQVQAPGGTVVVITPGVWLGVSFLNVNVTRARASEGIMGAIAPGNWLPALPDGTLLGARPADVTARHTLLYKRFADAWRVNETTSLFEYEPGLSPRAFTAEGWPALAPQTCAVPQLPGVPVAATPPAPIPVAEAEKVCAKLRDPARKKNCTADVAATGATVFAETYLATEKLLTRTKPRAPDLRTPANNAVIPAANVRFEWTKPLDPQAQGLTFRHCLWDNGELYDFNKCSTVAENWLPTYENWLNFAIIAAVALLVALILWMIAGRRLLILILLALAVAVWAGAQVYFIQSGFALGTKTADGLDPGKIYHWKVVAEDADGNLIESETRRLVVK